MAIGQYGNNNNYIHKASIENNNLWQLGPSQVVTPPRDLAWVKQPHSVKTMALVIEYGKYTLFDKWQ